MMVSSKSIWHWLKKKKNRSTTCSLPNHESEWNKMMLKRMPSRPGPYNNNQLNEIANIKQNYEQSQRMDRHRCGSIFGMEKSFVIAGVTVSDSVISHMICCCVSATRHASICLWSIDPMYIMTAAIGFPCQGSGTYGGFVAHCRGLKTELYCMWE